MTTRNTTGVQVDLNDPDICLIKSITGSSDLSEFSNLNNLIPLIDSEDASWNLLTTFIDVDLFKCYCEYLWDECYKLISKQKKNLQAIEASFPRVIAAPGFKKIFDEALQLMCAIPHNLKRHPQLRDFEETEYASAQREFRNKLRDDGTSLEQINLDVLAAEGSIFAQEWFTLIHGPKFKLVLEKLSDEKATMGIQPYQFTVSYIYHRLMKPLLESESEVVTVNDLYMMMKVYWLLKLAKDEVSHLKNSNFMDNAKNHRKNLPLSYDDFALKQLLPLQVKGVTIAKEKRYYRDIAIKAWAYTQTNDEPKPQYHLALDLLELKYYISMGEEGVRKHLRKLLKPGYLTDSLPEEWREYFKLETTQLSPSQQY